ncbi:dimethylarginine dimethylaminohydrolase family protein [Paenibacillus mucilaginosus]|uniref:Amidinotransferase family protein n=2 Tax=Paenibacillus mucilaginosus TaxID=61624 RepID=F8F7F5_PAEMK|nr:arginine deiminase family protein [Paenibacillus mucilaginosus]AEI45964.1 amidinotransferase family protein [Paenibacillus mucilaginosus KNP414]MCG7216822.1 arginine deiminase family protein [Paenibacillus mucilaginosus]WDM27311.1 amidinotransferase [Paenibacillus mucilaginosus]
MLEKERYLSDRFALEPASDKQLLQDIWGTPWGVFCPVGPIRSVLMHRPGEEVLQIPKDQYEVEAGSLRLREVHGRSLSKGRGQDPPDLGLLQAQHDGIAEALRKAGAEVLMLDQPESGVWPDRMFTRDLGMVLPGGVILSRFALYLRQGETRIAQETLGRIGVPILGAIHGQGFMEGGSFALLDSRTAAVGRSERVNDAGIEQLRQLLRIQEVELLTIDMPSDKIHLDEAFLMLDTDKALVNPRLLPHWFLKALHERNITMLAVDPEDPPLTINALAVAPGKVLFSSEGCRTAELLQKNGIEVIPVEVSEIYKMGGGIHCVTLPLVREEDPFGRASAVTPRQ